MKVVAGWMMEGKRPPTPEWTGEGVHPILGLTMEEIRNWAEASAANYTPRADSKEKTPAATPEQQRAKAQEQADDTARRFQEHLTSLTQPQS